MTNEIPTNHIFPYCEINSIKYKYDPETLSATVIESWNVHGKDYWKQNEYGDSMKVASDYYVPLTKGYNFSGSLEIPSTIIPPGETREYNVTKIDGAFKYSLLNEVILPETIE